MGNTINQQIIIGGVGGQGVLFVTRLLAEAAMRNDLPVLTSETHGMAQRGGNVVSHLKVGNFHSPMIRPGEADGLIGLKSETWDQLSSFLKPDAWAAVNRPDAPLPSAPGGSSRQVDADALAMASGYPQSVNLVMLGFSMAVMTEASSGRGLFCTIDDIRAVMASRLKGKPEIQGASLAALDIGYRAAGR